MTGSWIRFENKKLAVFGRCSAYHRETWRGIHIRLKVKEKKLVITHTHSHAPDLDHQLMGFGERSQGAKTNAERQVRRG